MAKLKGDRPTVQFFILDWRLKLKDEDKHVDASGVFCRTRVRLPPSPIRLAENFNYLPAVIIKHNMNHFRIAACNVINNSKMPEPCKKIEIEE